jgi:hypothetical protein
MPKEQSEMGEVPHISPRVRAYGKARIDVTRRAKDEDEWRRLWKDPAQPYPFKSGAYWKFSVVYSVEDYAAEIGFLIDVLGLPVLAFSPSQAQLASPDGAISLTILAAGEDSPSSPPEALRLQLNVEAILQTVKELERRGITFDQQPMPVQAGSAWQMASFRTPHGITIDLLGEATVEEIPAEPEHAAEQQWNNRVQDEDQTRVEEREAEESQTGFEVEGEQAEDQLDEQPEVSQAGESQPSLWPHTPTGADRQKVSGAKPVQTSKPGNGNLELTYDSLDEDTEADDDIGEDFP